MATIAFLGTGLLGAAFVEAALARGETVTVWNRTPAKARALEALGARAAATPAEAVVGAERVHLVLRDDAVVEEVIDAFRPGLGPDAVIIDHTTTLPALTATRSQRLNADGVRYLHCPVFVGPAAAREAKGTILTCGPGELFDRVGAALRQQAERVEYLGERPDLAAVYKLCGNAFIIGLNGLVADVLAVAAGSHVAASDALDVLTYFDPRATIAARGRKMATGDFTPTFRLAMARKDIELMLRNAGSHPLAVLPGIAARMDALLAQGHADHDYAVLGRDSVART
jgi:3-hydroxyisobutyrate dehydrogenase-like beta-hydroxyacid dehydrogenase